MRNPAVSFGFVRWSVAVWLVIAALGAPAQAGLHDRHNHVTCNGFSWELNRFDLDVDDDVVIITSPDRRHDRTVIEINGNYELYIDGDIVVVNDSNKELLKQFHTEATALEKEGHRIAREGARIGIKGAKLGLNAVGKVFKLLSSEYDAEDLEREMDREATKLELEAEELEVQAEKIEDMADDLEDQARNLRRAIPELGEVRWF